MTDKPALTNTDDEILDAARAVIDDESPPPVVTSNEVADELELGENSVRQRLNNLVEEEKINRTKKGRDFLYYFEQSHPRLLPGGLEEDVSRYADENDLTQYEAIRELVEASIKFNLAYTEPPED